MVRAASKSASEGGGSPAVMDPQLYNRFVAGVQPRQIELAEVSASTLPNDRQDVQVSVESKFVMSCPHRDDTAQTFTVEARLNLAFKTKDGEEVGQFSCLYRLLYQAAEPLTDAFLEAFTRRNAPLNVWPFMRELVLNLTQRFGWSGFVLPSFLIPPPAGKPQAEVNAETPKPRSRKAPAKKRASVKPGA